MTICAESPECPDSFKDCLLPAFKMDCNTGLFDISINECAVDTDCQIQSQVIMAVFAKGRDESFAGGCKGGWWGDTLGSSAIGSRLWTFRSARASAQSPRRAEQYLEEALSPLVDLGIIDDVTVNASFSGGTVFIDDIKIKRPDGLNNYSYLWEAGCGV